jgi:YbgC/YbaW family acyl-CoA thioester hydrolase
VTVLDRVKFRHSTRLRVRNYEIDWQGIVHNAVYLQYFETGRLAYLERLGVPVNAGAIKGETRIVVARNEIDYRSPALYGEDLEVLTRISSIRNTSFVFEGIIEALPERRIVAENVSVHVRLDGASGEPLRVADEFRRLVASYEGQEVVPGAK